MKNLLLALSIVLVSPALLCQTLSLNSIKNTRTFNQGFSLVAGSVLTGIVYAHQDISAIPLLISGAGGLSMMVLGSERQKKITDRGFNDQNLWLDPSIMRSKRNQSGWMIASLFYGLSMFALSQDWNSSAQSIGIVLTGSFTLSLVAKSLKKNP